MRIITVELALQWWVSCNVRDDGVAEAEKIMVMQYYDALFAHLETDVLLFMTQYHTTVLKLNWYSTEFKELFLADNL